MYDQASIGMVSYNNKIGQEYLIVAFVTGSKQFDYSD